MRRVLLAIILLIAVSACSKEKKTYQYVVIPTHAVQKQNGFNNSALLERFSDYWEASSRNDFKSAYAYELPYLNFLKSLDWYLDFKRNAKRRYIVTLLSMTPDSDDNDIVRIRANFKGEQLDVNLTEKWININGVWYHSYSQSILPPKPPEIH